MTIDASEISEILKTEIKNIGDEPKISEVGTVLTVGDGIARVYGLDNVQAGEMVEFPGKVKGMAVAESTDPFVAGVLVINWYANYHTNITDKGFIVQSKTNVVSLHKVFIYSTVAIIACKA